MTGLVVDGVSVVYDRTTALDRFTLEAAAGEIVAVVGPSGSGKSTLLRAVAGLEPLTEGRIVLDGRDLDGVATHRRGLGLMFQDHGLFTHLSVADNIAYGLRTAGMAKRDQRRRVGELLELVGLQGYGDRRTTALSGGEAQRVALARALAPEPGLLMLDEPLGSLDRALRDQLTGDLRRLLTELGQTALHVTHDQTEAFALADRVAVVSEGMAVAVGTPAELWADPGSRFVAEFLGHPNIWSLTVDEDGSVSWSGTDGPAGRLGHLSAGHPLLTGRPGPRLAVMPSSGIRPSRDRDGSASTGGAIEGRVVGAVFRRGVHDVSAALITGGAGSGPGEGDPLVHYTTSEPVSAGQVVELIIDQSALRLLRDDR